MYEASPEDEVLKYLPLVEKVAKRVPIKSTEYEYSDYYNIGVIGLIDALHKFDVTKKVPFESYAAIRIRGAIIDEVRKHSRISRYKMVAINNFYKAKQELEQDHKREVTDSEICEKMAISSTQLNEIYENIHYLASISLEGTIFPTEGEGGVSLGDVIPDNSGTNAEQKLMGEEREAALTRCIQKLNEREQLILSLYYKEEATLKEIAAILDISIARVSQIHGKVIAKLKLSMGDELS
ncbi:MAG: FliA/WhiG family RNA polymerase sigma factor [Liquorilactobacillus hordei]|uniref:sigma-70 family RNA polymerase sigma factor n=1 Tax=Liquorilactobacillus hordei TaxID=468911 RepID=UPI0039E818DD